MRDLDYRYPSREHAAALLAEAAAPPPKTGRKRRLTRAQVHALREWDVARRALGTFKTKCAELGVSSATLVHYLKRIRSGDLCGREDR